jgi:hypothetical protein
MRYCLSLTLTLFLLPGFTAAAGKHRLTLKDEGLPLQELRPLDRKIYVLTLDGTWKPPPDSRTTYYINFLFPNGSSYAHRVDDSRTFRQGEVRCIIQDYKLARYGVSKGGRFDIVVSAGTPVRSEDAPEVVSNIIHVSWPMDRPVSRFRPYTRRGEPAPVDAFPIPGEPPSRPGAPAVPPPPFPGEPGVTPGQPPPATVQPNLPPRPEEGPGTPPRAAPRKPAPPAEKVPVPPKKRNSTPDQEGSK